VGFCGNAGAAGVGPAAEAVAALSPVGNADPLAAGERR